MEGIGSGQFSGRKVMIPISTRIAQNRRDVLLSGLSGNLIYHKYIIRSPVWYIKQSTVLNWPSLRPMWRVTSLKRWDNSSRICDEDHISSEPLHRPQALAEGSWKQGRGVGILVYCTKFTTMSLKFTIFDVIWSRSALAAQNYIFWW